MLQRAHVQNECFVGSKSSLLAGLRCRLPVCLLPVLTSRTHRISRNVWALYGQSCSFSCATRLRHGFHCMFAFSQLLLQAKATMLARLLTDNSRSLIRNILSQRLPLPVLRVPLPSSNKDLRSDVRRRPLVAPCFILFPGRWPTSRCVIEV